MVRRCARGRGSLAFAADVNDERTPDLPEPERLVALGFRYWLLGRRLGDVACWERAWNLYAGMLGVAGARVAVSGLSAWVNGLAVSSCRNIHVLPEGCHGYCRDECIAVSMIAACQHQTCPAMRACAFALIESSAIDAVIDEAQTFADAMAGLELILSPASIVRAPVALPPASRLLQ